MLPLLISSGAGTISRVSPNTILLFMPRACGLREYLGVAVKKYADSAAMDVAATPTKCDFCVALCASSQYMTSTLMPLSTIRPRL